MKTKEKPVQVPGLGGRLPKAKLISVSEVVKRSIRQAQKIMDDPILQLGRAQHLKIIAPGYDIATDHHGLVWSHLVGQDYVQMAYISNLNLAKLILLFCSKMSGAYRQQSLRFPSLDGNMLNAKNSELVTPSVSFPKGLSAESPVYFVWDLSRLSNLMESTGDMLILSDNGLYRWQYTHKHIRGAWRQYPKNLKSKKRSVVISSKLERVSIEDMEQFISSGQVVPIRLLFGMRDAVKSMSGELHRLQSHASSVLDFANSVLGRIQQ